jgi:signal transduction histidine kinase
MIDIPNENGQEFFDTAKKLKHQQMLLHAVNETAQILLAAVDEEKFESSVLEGMRIISHCLDVDRGYIWQNETIRGVLHYAMRFEWQNDTGRHTNPVENKVVFPYTDIPSWEAKFKKGECVNGPLSDVSKEEQDRLLNHGMKSVFAMPVYLQNYFWGYVSFDDCRSERFLADDEINILRSVSLMMVNAINRNEQFLRNREVHFQRNNLLNTVNNIASILLQAEVDEFESSLLRCMGMMGEAANADRVYIWRNHSVDGKLYCTQLYEWSEGFAPEQGSKYTVDIPYSENIPGWEETLSSGQCVNGVVREMNSSCQAQLSPQGIMSLLVIPIFLREQFWGFVGFDDCHRERIFNENEVSILRSGSLLIAHAMLRNDLTLGLRSTAMDLESAFEEAQAANRAKSNFLSNMSHEMRTPMNAIIGMTQIGKSASDVKKKDYAFEKIEGASNHLLGVINDVLDMSKIEAGKFELSITEFEFEKMLQRAINVTGFRIEEKKQNFSLFLDPDIPQVLSGDDQRLTQVITNLLTNAVKFTPEQGSICLNTYFVSEENGICTIKVEVTDTGIGISRENQTRLFTSFEQAESSTSRKFGGTGLGLAICKRIVEMMDGSIWVESEPGKGSVFAFTVQLKRGAEESGGARADKETDSGEIRSFHGCRILLAEDVEINREIVISLLEPTEIEIDCAANGVEAMNMFISEPDRYDMIFMDMQMPQMDGLEATRHIREFESKLEPNAHQHIPIVAMTANVFKEDIEKCLEAGMNAHVGKPLDLSEVMEVLKRYLPGRNG